MPFCKTHQSAYDDVCAECRIEAMKQATDEAKAKRKEILDTLKLVKGEAYMVRANLVAQLTVIMMASTDMVPRLITGELMGIIDTIIDVFVVDAKLDSQAFVEDVGSIVKVLLVTMPN